MPRWLSMSDILMDALYVLPVVVLLRATWLRRARPSHISRIRVLGVVVPLALVSITLVAWGVSGHWVFQPMPLAIMIGVGAWAASEVARDTRPIRWGSRGDLLGRIAIAVAALCTAILGLLESHDRYGSPATVRQWYAIAIVLLAVAVVLKPSWLRAAFRTSTLPA